MAGRLDLATAIVKDHYFNEADSITAFSGGAINTTFLVAVGGNQYILQRMNPMFLPSMTADFVTVTNHLRERGWTVPTLVSTISGDRYAATDTTWWRMMSFIDSDGLVPRPLSAPNYRAIGGLLARLHVDLGMLDYELAYRLPHYHDSDYYAGQLMNVMSQLSDEQQQQAAMSLAALKRLPALPARQQLTHADPQTTNILFRGGKPFTFIDYDTLMPAGVWIDIGDMLRSLVEDSFETGAALLVTSMRSVLTGYYEVSDAEQSSEDFVASCLCGLQCMALQLSCRFLTDIVQDCYFDFDPAQFTSRRDYNIYRAAMQWDIYIQIKEMADDKSLSI